MNGGVFQLRDEDLVELREQAYDSEDRLQAWLAKQPNLLSSGDQLAGSPRRWLLVKREKGIPDHQGGGTHFLVDHLFVDQDAVPTLVEVKRSDDTRIRREVVGQMLDYAANGVVYWPAGQLRSDFEARCAKESKDPEQVFHDSLGDNLESDQFWDDVEQNLLSGRVRLVFVSDLIPVELRRVIEFLNERMSPTEVVGVEIKQYVGQGNLVTLVPRVIGQTEQAKAKKVGGKSPVEVDWDYYRSRLKPERFTLVRSLFDRIEKAIEDRGLGWVPVLRAAYFAFQRDGSYNCVGVDVARENPVDFWIKLPLPPDELRHLGRDVPRLYPELKNRWDGANKLWRWAIPSLETAPDVTTAIELTAQYQPSDGSPMPIPTNELTTIAGARLSDQLSDEHLIHPHSLIHPHISGHWRTLKPRFDTQLPSSQICELGSGTKARPVKRILDHAWTKLAYDPYLPCTSQGFLAASGAVSPADVARQPRFDG